MDPLTHMVGGALVAQAMLPVALEEHRLACTLVAAGAAAVADLDFLARKARRGWLLLKLHRGLTHSLLAAALIAAAAAGSGALLFAAPFAPLVAICAVAALSHLVLDTVAHASGVQWLWPAARRFTLPLVLGLNPLTASARCRERSLLVCLRCTMHSALLSPLVLMLWAAFALSLVGPRRLVSALALGAGLLYLAVCALARRRADGALAAASASRAIARRVFPSGFTPRRWLGVVSTTDGHETMAVDAWSRRCEPLGRFARSADTPMVTASLQAAAVQELKRRAILLHAASTPRTDGAIVVWRDLAFAASPVITLFAARVVLDGQGRVTTEEFLERWDRPPEE